MLGTCEGRSGVEGSEEFGFLGDLLKKNIKVGELGYLGEPRYPTISIIVLYIEVCNNM